MGARAWRLAIVKKLIELHGSNIHVESQVGHGATFYFTLYLEEGRAAPAENRNPKEETQSQVYFAGGG